MKLTSLKSVLALTAAFGIAMAGISCKPADKAADGKPAGEKAGSGPAETVKKDADKAVGEVKKEAKKAGDAVKKEAGKAADAVKKEVKKVEAK